MVTTQLKLCTKEQKSYRSNLESREVKDRH